MEKQIQLVHYTSLDSWWPRCKDFLQKGLEHSENEITLDQIRLLMTKGDVILVVGYTPGKVYGCAAVEFINFPNYRVANVITFGGDHFLMSDEEFAKFCEILKQFGATKVQAWCRKSAARWLRSRHAFEEKYTIVRKDL